MLKRDCHKFFVNAILFCNIKEQKKGENRELFQKKWI